jgi:uncharacterized protein
VTSKRLVLSKSARKPIATDQLPPEFWHGVEQFNQQQFYACHDTLEALWFEASEPERSFYQGVLQIAVACYHLSNHNWRGAVILLGEGINRLGRYPADYAGLDVEQFMTESHCLLTALQQAGSEQYPSGPLPTLLKFG